MGAGQPFRHRNEFSCSRNSQYLKMEKQILCLRTFIICIFTLSLMFIYRGLSSFLQRFLRNFNIKGPILGKYVPVTSSWSACYATDMTVIPSHIWNPVHLTKHKLFQVPNCYPSQSLYDPFQMSFDYHVCLTLHPFKYWIFTENSSLWVILKHKCMNKIKTPN